MKRAVVILTVSGLLLVIVLFARSVFWSPFEWRGTGLLALEKDQRASEAFDPYYLQKQMIIISNAVCTVRFKEELSAMAGVGPNDFVFEQVQQLRSTSILDVKFVTRDRDTAGRVASNGCVMLSRLYSTNYPTIDVSHIDTRVQRIPGMWRRVLDRIFP